MFKKIAALLALLQVMPFYAITGVQLKIQYEKSFIEEPCIVIEDDTPITLERDLLVVVIEQKQVDDAMLLTTKVYVKELNDTLKLLAKPTLLLSKGKESKATIAEHTHNDTPDNFVSILALLQ